MNYNFVEKKEYFEKRNYYLKLIEEMYYGDNNHLANLEETTQHLDYIFSNPNNNAFLVLKIENGKLLAMVNFLEYNNCLNEWCLFCLFTNQNHRKKGYGEEIMRFSILKLKDYKCSKLISGIEEDNIPSIKLHEKLGFKYSGYAWNEIAEGFPENHLGYIYLK